MSRIALLAAALLAVAGPATAQMSAGQAVAEAKANGLVGERYDGYVGMVADSGPMLRHRVQSINILRRSLYSQLATSRGVTLQEVGITAACQLLGTVGVGEYYAFADGTWRLRGRGQTAPVPDYCR